MKKLIIASIALSFIGCSNTQTINVEGKIAMYGSVPHNYLGVEDIKTHKVYKIENSKDFSLNSMQNKIVKAKDKLKKLVPKEVKGLFKNLL